MKVKHHFERITPTSSSQPGLLQCIVPWMLLLNLRLSYSSACMCVYPRWHHWMGVAGGAACLKVSTSRAVLFYSVGKMPQKPLYDILRVMDELGSLTARGKKLFWILAALQLILVGLFPDGSRVNRLRLGWAMSFNILLALRRLLYLPISPMFMATKWSLNGF